MNAALDPDNREDFWATCGKSLAVHLLGHSAAVLYEAQLLARAVSVFLGRGLDTLRFRHNCHLLGPDFGTSLGQMNNTRCWLIWPTSQPKKMSSLALREYYLNMKQARRWNVSFHFSSHLLKKTKENILRVEVNACNGARRTFCVSNTKSTNFMFIFFL